MLSSILNSKRAISVNIRIMRIFTRIREMLLTNKEILLKLEQLEGKVSKHDEDVQIIFSYLNKMINPEKPSRKQIGFKTSTKE